jgi:4-carboxymuconolactone decarboxylase
MYGQRRSTTGARHAGGTMDQKRFEVGMEARTRVLGEEYVTRALSTADSFNLEFQQLVTEYCWGEIWGRTVLTDKQRSLNNLCILAALNRPHEFKSHFRGAIRNGATLDELRDTLMQIAVYAGIPAGVEAFRLGREVLEAEGIVPEAAAGS